MIWWLCVFMIVLIWAYQTLTIITGGVSGGVLLALLTLSVSVPVVNPAGFPIVNFLLITLETVFYLFLSRMFLELVFAAFCIEVHLRIICKKYENK